jgi:VIT1/CCC1 family predicted Fe2+/Mn2+ transporter
MIEAFESKGMIRKDAEIVVQKIAQYEHCFVNLMVSEDLGLSIPTDENDSAFLTDAVIMLLSFSSFGLFSLAPYALVGQGMVTEDASYWIFMVWALLIVAILGASKSAFSNSSALSMGLESLIMSGICSVIAYFVGDVGMRLFDE